jgi:serine/threonine protein kinase
MPTTLERWDEAEPIVSHVLELSPEERAAYIAVACANDPQLRAIVERLIAVRQTHEAIFDDVGSSLLTYSVLPADYVLENRYSVVEPISLNVMSAVYRAKDLRNNRTVALKVLPLSVAERYPAEHKKLAALQHPNIVTLLDSGTTPDGSPYFTMEFVDGEPITDYCNHKDISRLDRLKLFKVVCDAVVHAHGRNLVHCDLKPENIMVSKDGVVQLLDFGIAKLLSEIGPHASPSGEYYRAMTLPFASPEQVRGEPTFTHTDIYSLGVILSVLITGHLPYPEHVDLSLAIQDLAPLKPSAFLREGAAAKSLKIQITKGDRTILSALAAKELDAIVLKCLQKLPEERYRTVEALSEDIRRYLEHYPLSVVPRTWIYSGHKAVERHRRLAGVTTLLSLLLLISLVALALNWREAIDQRVTAVKQRNAAVRAAIHVTELNHFVRDIFTFFDPEMKRGGEVTVREVLDRSVSSLKARFRQQPDTKVALLDMMGQIYDDLGLYDRAEDVYSTALSVSQSQLAPTDVLASEPLIWLSNLRRDEGKHRDGLTLARQALRMRRNHLPMDDQAVLEALFYVAEADVDLKNFQAAETLHRFVLRGREQASPPDIEAVSHSLHALGELLITLHRTNEGEPLLQRDAALRESLFGPRHPLTLNSMYELGVALQQEGKSAEAEHIYRRIVPLYGELFGVHTTRFIVASASFGALLYINGKYDESARILTDAVQRAKTDLGEDHPNTFAAEIHLARALMFLRRFEEAEALLASTYTTAKHRLGPNDYLVGTIVRTEGQVALKKGSYSVAEERLRTAVGIFLAAKQSPTAHLVISTRDDLGVALTHLGKFTEAEPYLLAFLLHADPSEKSKAIERLAELYDAWGKPDKGSRGAAAS